MCRSLFNFNEVNAEKYRKVREMEKYLDREESEKKGRAMEGKSRRSISLYFGFLLFTYMLWKFLIIICFYCQI